MPRLHVSQACRGDWAALRAAFAPWACVLGPERPRSVQQRGLVPASPRNVLPARSLPCPSHLTAFPSCLTAAPLLPCHLCYTDASRAKRQRVEHNAQHGGPGAAAAAGAAAGAAGGLPGEFPPLGPPQQQVALPKVAHGGWPMQQAQQVQQLERPGSGPAVTTGWQAGISQFQRRSGLTFDTAQRGQAERSPWELPAIVGAAAAGRPAGAAIGSPSIKVEMISPRDVAGTRIG